MYVCAEWIIAISFKVPFLFSIVTKKMHGRRCLCLHLGFQQRVITWHNNKCKHKKNKNVCSACACVVLLLSTVIIMLVLCAVCCVLCACANVLVLMSWRKPSFIVQIQNSSLTVYSDDNTCELQKRNFRLKYNIDGVKTTQNYEILIFGTSHEVMRCSCSGAVYLGKRKSWKQDWEAWVKMILFKWPLQGCHSTGGTIIYFIKNDGWFLN